MTSWRFVAHLSLFVFLSTIHLSKQGCKDYFRVNKWETNTLTDSVSLVKTQDFKDIMECTVENECLNGRKICHILYYCFSRQDKVMAVSEKCKGDTFQNISYYHFMCLTAKAFNYTPKGCEYEPTCQLYSGEAYTVFNQTTPPPTTTTTLPPPTSLPARTTTTTTTTTAAATVLPPRTMTAATTTTTKVTQNTLSGGNGQTSSVIGETDKNTADDTHNSLLRLFIVSACLNVILPLAVYLYMRQRRRQDHLHSGEVVLNGALSEEQPMTELETTTPQTTVNVEEVETSNLIQRSHCDSIATQSADTRNDCAVVNDMLP